MWWSFLSLTLISNLERGRIWDGTFLGPKGIVTNLILLDLIRFFFLVVNPHHFCIFFRYAKLEMAQYFWFFAFQFDFCGSQILRWIFAKTIDLFIFLFYFFVFWFFMVVSCLIFALWPEKIWKMWFLYWIWIFYI